VRIADEMAYNNYQEPTQRPPKQVQQEFWQ